MSVGPLLVSLGVAACLGHGCDAIDRRAIDLYLWPNWDNNKLEAKSLLDLEAAASASTAAQIPSKCLPLSVETSCKG